jgi:pyruvate formate lyase activating enzyme
MNSIDPKEARFYELHDDKSISCLLCPRTCTIKQGEKGFCSARKNIDGNLIASTYAKITSMNVDPIEKKPLNHFLPGSASLSVGSAGCNLGCDFCQNWSISKNDIADIHYSVIEPENLTDLALRQRCPSISYTYNEPTIFAEYVIDASRLAREKGVRNVMVTNGYVSKTAISQLYENIDAANVDLKAFDNDFYRKRCDARLQPVLDNLVQLNKSGIWIEITTLLIQGLNDSEKMIKEECKWIVQNLGQDVPVHFSAFHPDYRLLHIERTKAAALRRAKEIAIAEGIKYVYEGNVTGDGNNTYCPACGNILIRREWFDIAENNIVDSRCSCGEKIAGVFI